MYKGAHPVLPLPLPTPLPPPPSAADSAAATASVTATVTAAETETDVERGSTRGNIQGPGVLHTDTHHTGYHQPIYNVWTDAIAAAVSVVDDIDEAKWKALEETAERDGFLLQVRKLVNVKSLWI